jgi:mRNA interferase RelE/StbE
VPTYRVEFTPKARKQINALDQTVRRRVDAALLKLEGDPFHSGTIALQGVHGYRVRVGDYRVLYTVDRGRVLVMVVGVGHRREAYR